MKVISPWIHTTELCNLRCKYCYVRGNAIMQKPVYSAMKSFLLNEQFEHIHLRFAGGEPLLVFKEWEEFAKQMLIDERVSVEILTNFREVPSEFWSFSEHNKVNVSVSIDGSGDKPLNREISNKLKRLKDPWILTTVTPDNINHLDLLAAFIGKNNYGWALTTDYFQKQQVPEDELLIKLIELLNTLKEFNYDFNKLTFNNCTIKHNFSGCKAGTEMIAIDCDGNIYQCQTLIGNKNKIIGNVFKGFKQTPIVKFGCQNCDIHKLICYGWCPLYHRANNFLCEIMKIFSIKLFECYKEVENAKRLSM